MLGANMSRLEAETSALSVQKDNVSAARSRIADVDVAELKVPTLPDSKFWCNLEPPCWLRPMSCLSQLSGLIG